MVEKWVPMNNKKVKIANKITRRESVEVESAVSD